MRARVKNPATLPFKKKKPSGVAAKPKSVKKKSAKAVAARVKKSKKLRTSAVKKAVKKKTTARKRYVSKTTSKRTGLYKHRPVVYSSSATNIGGGFLPEPGQTTYRTREAVYNPYGGVMKRKKRKSMKRRSTHKVYRAAKRNPSFGINTKGMIDMATNAAIAGASGVAAGLVTNFIGNGLKLAGGKKNFVKLGLLVAGAAFLPKVIGERKAQAVCDGIAVNLAMGVAKTMFSMDANTMISGDDRNIDLLLSGGPDDGLGTYDFDDLSGLEPMSGVEVLSGDEFYTGEQF